MSDYNYYKIGGSLEYQHPTYVVRQADYELYEGLTNGEFCYVLNSRQMGKSSLRVQMMKKLKEQGIKCASIDMTRIGSHVTPSEWYAGIISELLRGFGLARKVNFSTWWREREILPPLQRLRELIEDVLLAEFTQKLVIFIDEIDSIIKIKFKEDFFAFIRACYNQRVDNPEYNRLTFCLLGVATPSDLIEDKNVSTPFNIGRAIELTGFQLQEATSLTQGLAGKTVQPQALMSEVLVWTGGQPFLTQKVCKLILSAEEAIPVGDEAAWVENLVRSRLIENWETQDEPEHLRTIRDRILWSQRKEQLLQLYQQILQTGVVKALDKPEHMELRLSGLVVKQQGKLRVYNRIYGSIFNQNWVENVLTEVSLLPELPETLTSSKAEILALEQAGLRALQMFEFGNIKALLKAMQAGQALQRLIKTGYSLQDYPTILPLPVLKTILDNIRERNWFKIHRGTVYSVCLNPDGQHIATTRDDGTVQLWNLFGQQLAGWKGHQGEEVDGVCFSPNGQLIATAGRDGTARLWNLSGQQIHQFDGHQSWVRSVSFSPNGQLIATAGADGTARLWNLLGHQLVQFDGHQGSVWSASFSPDGRRIATAGEDGTAKVWNLSGQQLVEFEGHQGQVWHVSFSPDGRKIATAGADTTARVWNLLGQQIAQLNGHQDWVRLVSFSPNGQFLATAGYDGTARVWNLSGQQLVQLNGHVGAALGMSFSPDGQLLVTAGVDGTVRLWDLSEKHLAQLKGHQGSVWTVSFSADGQLLATAGRDGTARLWNLAGQQLAQLKGHQGSVWSVSFSPDGQYIVTTGSDKTARLWNLAGQQLAKLDGHQGWVIRVIFSPDGQRLATVGRDGTARVWDLSGQLISQVTPQQGWVWSVSFSDDGQLVATVGLDATPPILDLSGRLIVQLKGYQGKVGNVSFSPDGQYLATAGDDGTARLWNLFGQQLVQFDSQQGWVIRVSFSPNGQLVATAGEDGSVCLWDLSGRKVSRFNSNQGTIYGISFSPDGQCLATAGQDGIVKLWRVEGLDELLKRGRDWLKDYFVTHPEALEKLEVCQNQISSAQEDKNLAGASEVDEVDEVDDVVSTSSPCATVVPDRLISECSINYTRLRDLLQAGEWQKADRETNAIVHRIAGREAEDWLREEDIENIPCTDLFTIDQLWVKYSKGRFGFSIQKEIWQSVGGTKNADIEIYRSFCESVGWLIKNGRGLSYSELTFNTTAPVGHLPGAVLNWLWLSYREVLQLDSRAESTNCGTLRLWWNIIYCLASRLEECNRQSLAPTTLARQRLVTTVSNKSGEGFLGEFLVHDKLVRIYQGDITNLVTDVIVSSDDTYLRMSGGVSWRILQVGGNEIYKETRNLIPSSLGDVAVTTAGKLQAKKIFHGVVLDRRIDILPFQDVIRQVVHTCLEKANQYGFHSIAFPLLGTGAGCFSVQAVWEITLRQIIKDLSSETQNISEVIVVVYGKTLPEELNVNGFLEKIEKFGWRSLL
jgi:WD40 repeat protein/O-acetyl-ADP-ribose deacetylase (regulator of RNase III)